MIKFEFGQRNTHSNAAIQGIFLKIQCEKKQDFPYLFLWCIWEVAHKQNKTFMHEKRLPFE